MSNELTNDLVSIIIPCYNGERTLARCLDSLLKQSWPHLEIVFVNDGSTDQSADIAKKYGEFFHDAGIIFKYREQKNEGLGSAINTGLKYVSGSYLCWGDVDDFWYKDSILIRKIFLDGHPEYGSVSSDAHYYVEGDLSHPIGIASDYADNLEDENQFMNHLKGRPLYCSGCHMLRTSAFIDVNPKREIYPAKHGQNNQLLMPIYYKYKHRFIPVPLYGCVISSGSMSHKKLHRREKVKRIIEYYQLMDKTVESILMPKNEMKRYLRINKLRKINDLIDEAAEAGDRVKVYYYEIVKRYLSI